MALGVSFPDGLFFCLAKPQHPWTHQRRVDCRDKEGRRHCEHVSRAHHRRSSTRQRPGVREDQQRRARRLREGADDPAGPFEQPARRAPPAHWNHDGRHAEEDGGPRH